MTAWVRCAALVVALIIIGGCSHRGLVLTRESEDSLHYVVIGFGVISVPKSEKADAVTATKSNVLGVLLSNQPGLKVGIGYGSSSVIVVPANAEDVRVEVGSCAGGGVRLTADRAVLGKPTNTGKED